MGRLRVALTSMQTSLSLKQLQHQLEQDMQVERHSAPDEEWATANDGGDDNFKVCMPFILASTSS